MNFQATVPPNEKIEQINAQIAALKAQLRNIRLTERTCCIPHTYVTTSKKGTICVYTVKPETRERQKLLTQTTAEQKT